jgi:hypothetical protein
VLRDKIVIDTWKKTLGDGLVGVDPIDLYVRHTSALANALFRLALLWIVPVRYDATLKLFADYKELW